MLKAVGERSGALYNQLEAGFLRQAGNSIPSRRDGGTAQREQILSSWPNDAVRQLGNSLEGLCLSLWHFLCLP